MFSKAEHGDSRWVHLGSSKNNPKWRHHLPMVWWRRPGLGGLGHQPASRQSSSPIQHVTKTRNGEGNIAFHGHEFASCDGGSYLLKSRREALRRSCRTQNLAKNNLAAKLPS
jgi:hypothetical protein